MIRYSLMSLVLLLGCAGGPAPGSASTTPLSAAATEPAGDAERPRFDVPEHAVLFEHLPSAPWSAEPLPETGAPQPLVAAWTGSENRSICAPVAPADLGAGGVAEPRVSLVDGGWAVEFDQTGVPGLAEDGSVCADCGRAAFGIAGTAMSPEELEGEDGELEPSFDDGSSAILTGPEEGEGVAAATLRIHGQDCVYQVWSFLGEAHLEELVLGLRFVAVGQTAPPVERVAQARLPKLE